MGKIPRQLPTFLSSPPPTELTVLITPTEALCGTSRRLLLPDRDGQCVPVLVAIPAGAGNRLRVSAGGAEVYLYIRVLDGFQE